MAEVFTLIDQAVKEHNITRVRRVVLDVGRLTCVEDRVLQFVFSVFAKETVVEGAELIINSIEARAYCSNCGEDFSVDHYNKVCPKCNTFSKSVLTGYELNLKEIEGEDDEEDKNQKKSPGKE